MNLHSQKAMLYLEIANEYKKYINLGILKHGDRLPSVRNLASELGINPNTVSKSYQLLEEEGFIKIYPKKGAYVSYIIDDDSVTIGLWREQIKLLKNSGLSKEKFYGLIEEIYGGKKNDWGKKSIKEF